MGLKQTIKRAVVKPLSATGIWSATRALLGVRDVALCYHRVVDDDLLKYQPGMVVSGRVFRIHLEWLARRFDIVDLAELAKSHLTGERPARPRAVITFDDGWLDNYEVAFPILKSMGVPATIYLPTGFVGHDGAYWNARVEYALRFVHERFDRILSAFPDEQLPEGCQFFMDLLAARPSLPVLIDRTIETVKVLDPAIIARMTDFIEMLAEVSDDHPRAIMDWPEVMEMFEAGVSFGSHSVNHLIMTQISVEECRRELTESRDEMTRRLGLAPLSFAYPTGNNDENVRREARRAGYLCAVAVGGGFVREGVDLFAIPRFSMHEGGAPDAATLDYLLSGLRE